MSVEYREPRSSVDSSGNHRRDYALGPHIWQLLQGVVTSNSATDRIRCQCGELVCFTTDGDGHLVALEARSRTRHICKERAA